MFLRKNSKDLADFGLELTNYEWNRFVDFADLFILLNDFFDFG
jgi:hypothetical protein